MNSIVKAMPKYDHHQHVLSDWLAELDQRFQLGEVGEDMNKITWCQLLISATESGILSSLDEDATWEDAKEALLTHLGIGSVRDEAWAALKNLKKGAKDIVELAGEAEKLAKRFHPKDEETAERHAVDAFLGALDKTLAAEVLKLGHRTMEDVVAAARRIEKIFEQQADSKMERLVTSMQDQIRILKKDLQEANEQIVAHKAATPPAAAMAAIPAPAAAAAAAVQPPPAAPAHHIYQDYSDEPNFHRLPRRQMDRHPPRCFLYGEEGHFVSNLPLPLTTSTRITVTNQISIVLPTVKWIVTPHVASYAAKKATSCSTPPPPAGTHQRPRPGSRTNTGTAKSRGRFPPQP